MLSGTPDCLRLDVVAPGSRKSVESSSNAGFGVNIHLLVPSIVKAAFTFQELQPRHACAVHSSAVYLVAANSGLYRTEDIIRGEEPLSHPG